MIIRQGVWASALVSVIALTGCASTSASHEVLVRLESPQGTPIPDCTIMVEAISGSFRKTEEARVTNAQGEHALNLSDGKYEISALCSEARSNPPTGEVSVPEETELVLVLDLAEGN